MSDDLRLAVVGLGSMGRHHARVVRQTPGLELVGLVDPEGDRFSVAGGLPVLPTLAALDDVDIDAAIVSVPTSSHEDVALRLAERGVHVMIEKPVADSVAAAERIRDAFSASGLIGVVGYVERRNPALVAMRSKIGEGLLGEIYQITTSRQGPFPARIFDVGVVKDLATHDADLTPWLAGSPYDRVTAQMTHRSGREHEDMVVASGRLRNGVIVNHLVNWLSPRKERECVVTGERGALVADLLTSDLTFYQNGTVETDWDAMASFRGMAEGDATRFALHKREPLAVQMEDFRDTIRGSASADPVSLADGVDTLRVIEAFLSSARDGRLVTLAS